MKMMRTLDNLVRSFVTNDVTIDVTVTVIMLGIFFFSIWLIEKSTLYYARNNRQMTLLMIVLFISIVASMVLL